MLNFSQRSRLKSIILWFMAFIFVLSSCTTTKQLTYLNDIDEAGTENFFPYEKLGYRIQEKDILYVRFVSRNEEINEMMNPTISSQQTNQTMVSDAAMFLNGYSLDKDGNINLPLIGKIHVNGKSMDEITALIEEEAAKYIKDATVIVRLVTFRITVLGEVKSVGTFLNYKNHLTVLDALAMAGDITVDGNREKVLVLRPSDNGTTSYRINLHNKDLLSSEAFFLLPNDVVIVEPLPRKAFWLNQRVYTFAVSVLGSYFLLERLFL